MFDDIDRLDGNQRRFASEIKTKKNTAMKRNIGGHFEICGINHAMSVS